MTLEQQVCSLELAKKLKELGVKQESLFWWSVPDPEKGRTNEERDTLKDCLATLHLGLKDWGECFDSYPAFTVAELGEMLPKDVEVGEGHSHRTYPLYISFVPTAVGEPRLWEVGYSRTRSMYIWETGENEADARAEMLVYLLENNLIQLQ